MTEHHEALEELRLRERRHETVLLLRAIAIALLVAAVLTTRALYF